MTDSKHSKAIEHYKSEAKEATDAILMDIMDQHGDFKDYQDEVVDWSWDNICNN